MNADERGLKREFSLVLLRAVIAASLTVSLPPALAGGDQAAESVFVKGSEIYCTKPGTSEVRQLTTDGLGKGLLVTSKDGRRFAFVRDCQGRALGDIVVMLPDGTTLREIRFRPPEAHVSGMRFIEGLEWISDQRLVVFGKREPIHGGVRRRRYWNRQGSGRMPD